MDTVNPAQAESRRQQEDQERAVGISVYVRPDAPGFTCTVKQRYTDFLVNEILPNGQVLHLTESSKDQDKKRKRGDDDEASRKKQKDEDSKTIPATTGAEKKEAAEAPEPRPNGSAAAPKQEADASAPSVQEAKEKAIAGISDEDKSLLQGVFGEDVTASILNLYASVMAHPDRKARDHATVHSEPFAEKSKRTEAHMCIRRIFSSRLETLTVQEQEHQSGPGTLISIKASPPKAAAPANGGNRSGDGQRGKQQWSELGGEYLHFTLYKENKDTMEVLYFLASQLKMHMKNFSFAGTKDRRGVTVQRVAIYRTKRERMEALNRLARQWRIGGPFEHKKEGLELGMLAGNEFLLTLRDATFDGEQSGWTMEQRLQHAEQVAKTAAKGLGETGYLNYYGLQRFGTYSTGTHVVGMKMLKGDLKGAIDSILSYDESLVQDDEFSDKKVPQDDISRAKSIAAFRKSGDSRDALPTLPTRFTAERSIVTHMGKGGGKNGARPNENDFQGGLMAIQRNLRLMYVHAYQSLVWNSAAGKRWEMFGDKVVEGDLVVVGEKEQQEGTVNGAAAIKEEADEDGEPIIHPSASAASGTEDAAGPSAAAAGGDDTFMRARPLTKAEAESGRYNVLDVVLPLPGFDVVYPRNEIGKFYEEFMASEQGGGIDPHNMRRAWKDISLPGGYRKMMSRPLKNGVEVEVKAYSGLDEQMVQTDLEKLEKPELETSPEDAAEEKNRIAVILKMQLGSSQYATMALRELTKGGAVGYRPDYSTANR